MTDYNLAKPDPNLGPKEVVMGDEATLSLPKVMSVRDQSGFRPGEDRMKSAPEFLADSREVPGPPADLAEENRRLIAQNLLLLEAVNTAVRPITEDTSDGYHTFRELYDHRRALTAALAELLTRFVWAGQSAWRSREHHPADSEIYPGHFIVGIELPNGTVTYHYANQYWDDFQNVPELDHAPKWDGAGSPESVTRLIDFARGVGR